MWNRLEQISKLQEEVQDSVLELFYKYIKDYGITYMDKEAFTEWRVEDRYVNFAQDNHYSGGIHTLSIDFKFFDDYDTHMNEILEYKRKWVQKREDARQEYFDKREKAEYQRLKKKFGMVAL